MHKLSLKTRVAFCLLPLLLLPVSACGGAGQTVQSFPPAADLKAASEPKPVPSDAIVTDPQANARYDVAHEGWADRGHDAGVRLCLWAKGLGAKLPFECERGPGPLVR